MLSIEPDTVLAERYSVLETLESDKKSTVLRVRDLRAESHAERALTIYPTKREPGLNHALSPIDLKTLLSFEHPHFLKIYGGGRLKERDNAPYLVSDPIQGMPFLEWVETRDPSLQDWTAILCQCLEALGYLHERGRVHLRFSDKILRVHEGRAILTHYGSLCHDFEPSELRGEIRSPYMAPELWGGQPLDQRADFFALGVLLYRVVTGDFPFGADRSPNLDGEKSFRLSIPHSPLSSIFSPLLQNLLASEPSLRKRLGTDIIEDLQIIAGQNPDPRGPKTLSVLVPQFIGRRAELSKVNSAVSFLTESSDFPKENEGLLQAHRGTRLMVHPNEKSNANTAAWISIHGEKGLGKARLISEFAQRLLEKGIDFIWLSGQGLRTALFDSVSEIIERLLSRPGALKRTREAPESTRRELLRFLPDLVTKIPPPASRPEDDDEFAAMEDLRGERDRMIDGLSSFMIQEARAHPYVLVVTDSDALSELSQTLIAHLARRVATSRRWQQRFARGSVANADGGPIPLFIVTSSDTLPEDDGASYDDGRQLLRLSPLQQWEASRLIGATLGVDRIEEKSAKWLTMVSAGHPGRLIEKLREYLDQFHFVNGFWALHESVFEDISAFAPKAKDSRQISGMSGPTRLALAIFAYLERPLSAKLLLASLGETNEAGVEVFTELLTRRWILRRSDQRFTLANHALGQGAKDNLQKQDAEGLEGRILSALVAQYELEGREDQLVELVEFAARIGDAGALNRFGMDAAARYERIRADERAIALYQALLNSGESKGEDSYGLRVRLASCLFRNESIEEAVLELRQVFDGTVSLWPAAPRLAICRRLAVILGSEGRDDEAFETFERGETIVEGLDDIDEDGARELAALLAAKADFLLTRQRNLEDVSRLCERAQKALRTRAATGKGRDLALVRARLLALQGRLDFLHDKFSSAEQLTRAALAIQERYGAVLQVARSYYRLGNIELSRDKEGVAEKHWHKALKVRRQFGDRYGVAHILSNLSLSAARLGRMEKARDFILQSLRIREESGDIPGRAAALHNLGFIYESAGNLQRAVASYNECLALREELNDIHYAARVQNNLAYCLFVLGETMEARDRFVSALMTLREEEDKRGEATALARLAEIDFHRGRFEKAVQRASEANEIRLEMGGSEDLIESLQINSTIELGLGNHNKAVALIYEAVETARKGRYQVQLARSLLLYGRVLIHIKEFDSAKSALLEAQTLYESIGDTRALRCVAMEIGTVYLGVGLHSDANYLISPSIFSDDAGPKDELGYGFDKVRELHISTLLQLLNREGDPQIAKAGALEAIEICNQNHFITQKWRSLRLAAAAAEALGDQNEAQDFAAEAQEIVEDLSTKVPLEYQNSYLDKAAVRAAIRGDPSLQSLKTRYLRRARQTPARGSKKLGVTITRPSISRPIPVPTPRQTPPSTVHIKRLRTRSSTTEVVTPEATGGAEGAMRAAELATLIRLNRKILARGSRRKILAAILTAAVKLSRAERGFLGVEGGEGSLDIICAQNMDREDARLAKNAFSLRMAERCVATGKLIVSKDAAHDPLLRRHSSLLGIGVRSVLAVPFRSSALGGVIYLDHRFQRGAFQKHQQNLVQGLADQAGIVYELADSPESSEMLKLPKMDFVADQGSDKVYRLDPFFGVSDFMEDLYQSSPKWAESKDSLLIIGESGAGKQTLARTLHELGPRKREPLVVLDCRTVPDELVEAELFGHIAGVYEGAVERAGLLRSAGKGTLVIDGLWQASDLVKSRLLTALRSRSVRPLGSDQVEDLEARVVTLAPDVGLHRLKQNVSKSLFALLSSLSVTLCPIRERAQDIPYIVQEMLLEMSAQSGSPLKTIEKEALDVFMEHPWYGNYWELRKAVSDAWRSAEGNEVIRVADLPTLEQITDSSESEILLKDEELSLNMDEAVKRTQREMILKALDLAADREEAATLLGIQRRKLNRLIKKLDIET